MSSSFFSFAKKITSSTSPTQSTPIPQKPKKIERRHSALPPLTKKIEDQGNLVLSSSFETSTSSQTFKGSTGGNEEQRVRENLTRLREKYLFVKKNSHDPNKQEEVFTSSRECFWLTTTLLNSCSEKFVLPVKMKSSSNCSHILFDEKSNQSIGHKRIMSFIKSLILKLDKPILRGTFISNYNYEVLIKWLGKNELTNLEKENLINYKKALIQLRSAVECFLINKQQNGNKIIENDGISLFSEIKKEEIKFEKVKEIFDQMNICILQSFGDENPNDQDNTDFKAAYFEMRYGEIMGLLEGYLISLDEKHTSLEELKLSLKTSKTDSDRKSADFSDSSFKERIILLPSERKMDWSKIPKSNPLEQINSKEIEKKVELIVDNFFTSDKKKEVTSALKELSNCFHEFSDDKIDMNTKSPHRPGSVGLTIEDIDAFLFKPKQVHKEETEIGDFLCDKLPDLNGPIPLKSKCLPKKSHNAAIFLSLIDLEQLTESYTLNLFLIKEVLSKVIEVLKEPERMHLPFNDHPKVKQHLEQLRTHLENSLFDEEKRTEEERLSLLQTRINEVRKFYESYTNSIEKRINFELTKDLRFKDYLMAEQESKKDKRTASLKVYHNCFQQMPPSNNPLKGNALGFIGCQLKNISKIIETEWATILTSDALEVKMDGNIRLKSEDCKNKTAIEKLRNILDLFVVGLNLNQENFVDLFNFFITEPSVNLHDKFDLSKFLKHLGLVHNLTENQLLEISTNLQNGFLSDIKNPVIKEICTPFGEIFRQFQHKNLTNLPLFSGLRLVKMCEVLTVIEQHDPNNAKRKEFCALLSILRLLNQELCLTYMHTLNPLYASITGDTFAESVSRKKNKGNEGDPEKSISYEIEFEKEQVFIRGIGCYVIKACNESSTKSFLRETLTLCVPKGQESKNWSEFYETKIILLESPTELIKQKIDLFRILCHKHHISCEEVRLLRLK